MKFYTLEHPNTGESTDVYCHKCAFQFSPVLGNIVELNNPDPTVPCSICGKLPFSECIFNEMCDDLFSGKSLKKAGQSRVLDNENEEWKSKALDIIQRVCMNKTTLTADDFRMAIKSSGIGDPHHKNIFGALMKVASSNGWITKTNNYEPSAIPSRHGGMLMVWRSLIS